MALSVHTKYIMYMYMVLDLNYTVHMTVCVPSWARKSWGGLSLRAVLDKNVVFGVKKHAIKILFHALFEQILTCMYNNDLCTIIYYISDTVISDGIVKHMGIP